MSSRTSAASDAWTVDGAAQAMTRANVPRQQLVPVLEHGRAQRPPLRQRQALPGTFEERFVLAEQPLQRAVQVFEVRRPPGPRLHIVPDLVREALDVVGQVAGEIDDRRAETRRGSEAGSLEPRFDEGGETIGRNLLQAHDGSGLVERPALAEHPLHQCRLGAREDVAHLPLLLHGGAERVLDAAAVERPDRLEFVERDRHPAPSGLGDAARKRKDLLGEVGHVAIGPHGGERHRDLAAPAFVGLDPDLGPDAGQHLAQPRPGPVQPRVGRRQRPCVAFEEGDVGAVAADLHLDGEGAASGRALQGLPHQ